MNAVQIAEAVEAKLNELDAMPMGLASGRRLELAGLKVGARISPQARRELMRLTMTDIAQRLGLEFFQTTPAVALEQFIIVSVQKDHDTAGLLKSVVNSFMVSYLTPETTDRAYALLEGLELLRQEVVEGRQRSQPPGSTATH